jgi:hypothetical protein
LQEQIVKKLQSSYVTNNNSGSCSDLEYNGGGNFGSGSKGKGFLMDKSDNSIGMSRHNSSGMVSNSSKMFQKKKPAYTSILKDYQPLANRDKSAKPNKSPPQTNKYSGNDLMNDLKAKIPTNYDYLDRKGLMSSPPKYLFGKLKI